MYDLILSFRHFLSAVLGVLCPLFLPIFLNSYLGRSEESTSVGWASSGWPGASMRLPWPGASFHTMVSICLTTSPTRPGTLVAMAPVTFPVLNLFPHSHAQFLCMTSIFLKNFWHWRHIANFNTCLSGNNRVCPSSLLPSFPPLFLFSPSLLSFLLFERISPVISSSSPPLKKVIIPSYRRCNRSQGNLVIWPRSHPWHDLESWCPPTTLSPHAVLLQTAEMEQPLQISLGFSRDNFIILDNFKKWIL